jgi:hypothetical protein
MRERERERERKRERENDKASVVNVNILGIWVKNLWEFSALLLQCFISVKLF